MKFMDKLAAGLEKFLMPIAEKLGRQKQLSALRDGFIATLPISLTGSMASLFKNVFFTNTSFIGAKLNTMDAYVESVQPIMDKYLIPLCDQMWWGTLAITSIFIVITVAYALGRNYDVDPLATALVSIAAFFALIPQSMDVTIGEGAAAVTGGTWGLLTWGNFNSTAMFTGMIVALIGGQIFIALTKKGFVIKMPEQVPPAVSKAFSAVIPAFIVIFISSVIFVIVKVGLSTEVKVLIEKGIQEPLMKLGQSPATYVILILLSQLLWFFGLHGLNMIEPALNAMYSPALNANLEAVQAGKDPIFTLTRNFVDVYAMPGGSGGTLALLIAIFIFSKRQENRELAKLAIAPGIFQINEPVIFGLPLVLNPIYFIPFVIVPPICLVIAYVFTEIIPFADKLYIAGAWTTPPVISAVVATGGDLKAGILAFGLLILSILIWTPFVIAANKMGNEE